MNPKISCRLICSSSAEHLTQLYTGFGELQKREMITLKLSKDKNFELGSLALPKLKVLVNDEIKVVYDTFDGESVYLEDLAWCDVYFKRSFDVDVHSDSRIYPLGFNYSVYGPNDHSAIRSLWALQTFGINTSIDKLIIPFIRSNYLLSKLFKASNGRYTSQIRSFEQLPRFDLSTKIIFMARVWDPNNAKSAKKVNERYCINEMRAECIRKLRKTFGNIFMGGFSPDAYAIQNFPDCVIEETSLTKKHSYLKLLAESNICVSTMGLLKSNGWKLAEYIAGAKAIVSEKLHYQVPGNFQNGKNYLEFSTPNECVECVSELVEDPEKRYELMQNNYSYYNAYLRPDMLIWNSLKRAIQL